MGNQAEKNKRKQRFLLRNGVNVKVDGSWGPWQQAQYEKLTTKEKPYQTTPLGLLSFAFDKLTGNSTYQEDPPEVKGYDGEIKSDDRSNTRRWIDQQMSNNRTPLGYVTQTVLPTGAVAAAVTYGAPVLYNAVTKGAPFIYNGIRTAASNPATIKPALKTGANAGLQLGKTLGKEAIKAGVGMAAVNGTSKVTTGKTWGENVAQSTGMSHELAEWTNPGAYGPTYLKNVAKRGVETAMRTTSSANPISEIQQGLSHVIKKDPKRALSIGNYVLTGTRIGNKGYYNSLALDPNNYYSGFFKKNPGPPVDDLIDAFLYKKPIHESYGLSRINTKDYGVHSQYIKDNYPNKDIPIYEVGKTAGQSLHYYRKPIPDNYKADITGRSVGSFKLPSGHLMDVGGHLKETAVNEVGEPFATRFQDIWKFNPKDYTGRWKQQFDNINLPIKAGLKLVDHLGTPVVTRTQWVKPEFAEFN